MPAGSISQKRGNYANADALTPGVFSTREYSEFYVGTAGILVVMLPSGKLVTFKNASGFIRVRGLGIDATSTAADVLGLY